MKEETILKNEWIKRYELTAVSNFKYYKIAGCFILGFELVRTQCEIQPHFVLYPLWKKDIKTCMQFPYILHCIEDSRGFNYQVPISDNPLLKLRHCGIDLHHGKKSLRVRISSMEA